MNAVMDYTDTLIYHGKQMVYSLDIARAEKASTTEQRDAMTEWFNDHGFGLIGLENNYLEIHVEEVGLVAETWQMLRDLPMCPHCPGCVKQDRVTAAVKSVPPAVGGVDYFVRS